MPGNEVGDRVHNFFAQDNLSQGQHNSQSLDGNWPVLNNNLWAGSQRPAGILSSNAKNFSLQQQGTKFRYCSWIFFDTSINCFSYYCCVSSLAFFFPLCMYVVQAHNLSYFLFFEIFQLTACVSCCRT